MKHLKLLNNTIFIYLLTVSFGIVAQTGNKTVYLSKNDTTVEAMILITSKNKIKPKQSLFYYWFKQNKIYRNQGGVGGNLLHGEYKVYSSNHQLINRGQFDKGLKKGMWLYWDNRGIIVKKEIWKKGQLKQATHYLSDTVIVENYKNGKLHGKQKYFVRDTLKKTICWVNGEIKTNNAPEKQQRLTTKQKEKNKKEETRCQKGGETEKEPFWRRIFPKKEKKSSSETGS